MTESNSAENWAKIISAGAEGASSGLNAMSANASSRREAKEAKRRTLSNLLNNSLKNRQNLFRMGQENSDDMNDFQANALQQVAKGFVESLRGSSNYL